LPDPFLWRIAQEPATAQGERERPQDKMPQRCGLSLQNAG
jgi:hypothetical protein